MGALLAWCCRGCATNLIAVNWLLSTELVDGDAPDGVKVRFVLRKEEEGPTFDMAPMPPAFAAPRRSRDAALDALRGLRPTWPIG